MLLCHLKVLFTTLNSSVLKPNLNLSCKDEKKVINLLFWDCLLLLRIWTKFSEFLNELRLKTKNQPESTKNSPSVNCRVCARYNLSGPTIYCCLSNSASNLSNCSGVKIVRTRLLFNEIDDDLFLLPK